MLSLFGMQAAIVNSQTLEEVARLEKALKTGQLPADLKIPGDDSGAQSVRAKDDKMTSDSQNEPNFETEKIEELRKDESAPMEEE
ncbi:hypothetical protein SLEP1_g43422 [Rubroshorea leprosula]|uniref:Uncharacterized protein n=1 Tax=Rubroshorea leprosula TaxID=152421 RepID=A0AAV5LDW8_9ROSI|nr:hypothetical protein SLEP1_g43422 [Rubroshorea leprosula]